MAPSAFASASASASASSSQGHRTCQGERPQGIRRSARLQKPYTSAQIHNSNSGHQAPPATTTQPTGLKRKRSHRLNQPVQKRQRRTSTPVKDEYTKSNVHTTEDVPTNSGAYVEPASSKTDNNYAVSYWAKHQQWPLNFLKSGGNMDHLLAKQKSTSTLRRKSSASSINSSNTALTPSDQKPREAKSIMYARKSYETILATKGIFMDSFHKGIAKASIDLCQTLLSLEQTTPQHSLFRDHLFKTTCRKLHNRNEAMIVRDISPLIVPSAQTLATCGAVNLNHLFESVNEGWNSSIPFYGPRPQPDYSVGFDRSAFTDDQLKRLEPFVGKVTDDFTSYFMATFQMYFPFLTCEVKCGASSLDVADRQNAHSMTLAVRAVVELFRLVKREKEIDREILAFSVSHDDQLVRIYGHYPVIDGKETKYYRHLIDKFDFTARDGKDKWTAYKFTKNVYDNWMPDHLKRICSVIDEIPPDISFDVSQEAELQFSSQTGLSQELESHHPLQSESSASVASWDGVADVRHTTPNTSLFEQNERNTSSLGTAHMPPPPRPIVGQKRARQDSGVDIQHVQSLKSENALLREELEALQEWKRSLATE